MLDLGCGDGELLSYLIANRQSKGRGIEISEAGVLACVSKGLSVRQGNLNEGLADYPNGSFDYVILSQTLPFLERSGEDAHGNVARAKRDRQLPQLWALAGTAGTPLHRAHSLSG